MLKTYEDLLKFSKDNLNAAVAFNTTLTKGLEDLYRENVGFAGKALETAVEAGKEIAAAKSPVDVASVQTKVARETVEALVAQSRKVTELTSEALKAALEPVNARAKEAMTLFAVKAA
ncbi:phasin family protein [Pararhodospirillum photometricum]|nr:phasin family protein [Pararhodospirillum photometricum]